MVSGCRSRKRDDAERKQKLAVYKDRRKAEASDGMIFRKNKTEICPWLSLDTREAGSFDTAV
jgi:hypothetical protein